MFKKQLRLSSPVNACLGVIVGLLLLLIIIIIIITTSRLHKDTFDKTSWNAARMSEDYRSRRSMAGHLVDQHVLVGLNRDDLIKMLGHPDKEGRYGESDLSYYIGIEESPFAVDSAWLTVWLDNNIVIKSAITTD